MKQFGVMMLLPILFLAGCSLLDDSASAEIRIVPGRGIDGVRFGDSKEKVQAELGVPDGGGIADGFYRSWIAYDYEEGPHAGLSVYHLEQPLNTAGPADLFTIHAPYDGTTKEGIGIDSPLSEVRAAYGEPKAVYDKASTEKGVYTYVYCIGGGRLQIGFREDRVEGLGLGHYKPPPNDECRS